MRNVVPSAQGRLRALLRASAVVASDLSLPVVLRQIVEAARELADAKVRRPGWSSVPTAR